MRLDVFIDNDTSIIQSACVCQDNYIVFKDGLEVGQASSMKAWKENQFKQWRRDNPDTPVEDYVEQEFDFKIDPKLKQVPDDGSGFKIEHRGKKAVKDKAKKIKDLATRLINQKFPDLYTEMVFWYCIQGEDNFRDVMYPDYKGNRQTPILLKDELKQYGIKVLPNVIVSEGEETDDVISKYSYKGYLDFKKTGYYSTAVVYLDKDLKNTQGLHINYNFKEEDEEGNVKTVGEIYEQSPDAAIRHFLKQMLMGDTTDNIKGVNGSPCAAWWDTYKKLDPTLRRSKIGVGEKTALKVITACPTVKDAVLAVVEAYKGVHGDSYKEALDQEAIALWMRRFEDQMFKFTEFCEKLDIDLE